eukprot:gene16330-19426_t
MSESSWLELWEGDDKDDGAMGNMLKQRSQGNVGDWSSFAIAMDDEGGQELHRSLSTMRLKEMSDENKMAAAMMGKSPLKTSGGIEPPRRGLAPPQQQQQKNKRLSTGLPQLSSSPNMIGQPSSSHIRFAKPMGYGANLAASIHFQSEPAMGSPDMMHNPLPSPRGHSEQHMPMGSPVSPLSSSPIHMRNHSAHSSGGSGSPPLSVSPATKEDSGFFGGFFRKKRQTDERGVKRNSIPALVLEGISNMDGASDDGATPRGDESDEMFQVDENLPAIGMSINSDKIMEGWMERNSSRSSWKKHWFVLRGIHLEYYKGWWEDKPHGGNNEHKDAKDVKEAEKSRIALNYWYTFTRITHEEGKYVFSIVQTSDVEKNDKKSKLKFRVDDEATAKKWIHEMDLVIKRRKETTVTLRPLMPMDHRQPSGRRATVAAPPTFVQPTGLPSQQVFIPKELIDELEPDEKKVLETIKGLLDEFQPKPLPEGETPSSYRNKPRSNDGFYRIMSLDGGGLRSVMVCVLIERIVKRFPKFLDVVDIFTGTSAGAIVAAGLAVQYPPKGTRRVLELTALPVFGKKRAGFNMGNAKYFNRLLRASCYVFFQDKRFYELPRKLVVPAFQLDSHWPPAAEPYAPQTRRWMPAVFHNVGKCDDWLTQEVVGDALLRSGAAPTFFPAYQGFIDGGVFCNNPGLAAMSLAMSPTLDNIPSNKIICFSLATGLAPHFMDGSQEHDLGLLGWAPKLGNLFMGSQVEFLTQLCENILGESRYHRVNPLLGEHTSMDDPKLVSELATLANQVDLTTTFEWIEKHWFPADFAQDPVPPTTPRP